MSNVDRSSPVRPGEELPIERLVDYLSTQLPEVSGPVIVEQFPAGFSNLTYLLRFADRELVLRRPPIGAKIKTAHDMSREYRILSYLHPVYPKVPRPVLFCDDESILGAPFYVMERVSGVILRAQKPHGLDLSSELMRRLSETFVNNLAEIHEIDYEAWSDAMLLSKPPAPFVATANEDWVKPDEDEVCQCGRLITNCAPEVCSHPYATQALWGD